MANNKFNLTKGNNPQNSKFNLSKSEDPIVDSIQEKSDKKTKKSKTWLWILLSIVVVGGIVFLIVNNSSKESIDEPQTNQMVSEHNNSTDKTTPNDPEIASTNQAPNNNTSNNNTQTSSGNVENQNRNENTSKNPYTKGETYKVYQFPFGESNYNQPDSELDKLVNVLIQNPSLNIAISAYTDNVGTEGYNQALSSQRAKAIRDYLVNKGIDANRITSQGKGISTKYSNSAENRRAEFIIK